MTVFQVHPNNVTTSLASAYVAGSGSLVLASGTGALFGSTFPMTVTVVSASTYGSVAETYSIYTVTGRSTDTLTGVTVTESTTDRAYAIGDRVEVRWTSGLATAIETAANNLENSVVYAATTYTNPGFVGSLDGSKINTGLVPATQLGGTGASNLMFLRGDSTWNQLIPPVGFKNLSTSYTALATDVMFLCNGTSTAMTVTLPAALLSIGHEFIFLRTDNVTANGVWITRSGTDVMSGNGVTTSTTYALSGQWKFARLVATNGTWWVIAQN